MSRGSSSDLGTTWAGFALETQLTHLSVTTHSKFSILSCETNEEDRVGAWEIG